jgi:cyclopropane fatty-acyl-phospholipid synthase-like methyltransferase
MRSNVEYWQQLQSQDYFENHPYYKGLTDFCPGELSLIQSFLTLTADMKVVVIGCGYGRESAHIAPHVKWLYGIDVNDVILTKAVGYLSGRSVTNFTPVRVDRYKELVPNDIDLVFSVVVMQHITRDLVADYFSSLSEKLKTGGTMLIQFVEHFGETIEKDAELRTYEPDVTWTLPELLTLCRSCGLTFSARSVEATPTAMWHWVHAQKRDA